MNTFFRFLRCTVMFAVMITIPTVMNGALPDTTTVHGTHLYKIILAKNNSPYLSEYFITPSSPIVSIKKNPGANELWYIIETDDTPTGTCTREHIDHYCYIVNAVSGQYLYYTGTDSNNIETNVVEMKDINAVGLENDRFKFLIKQSGNGSAINYWMFPKIAAENNKISGSDNLWESNSKGYLTLGVPQGSAYANGLTLSKEKNGVWSSQWVFVSSSLLDAPTITFDNSTNRFSISHDILSSGCTIYYTTDNSTPTTSSTQYTAPVLVDASTTVKAVVTLNGYKLTEVASVAVEPVPVLAPTITNNFDGTISLSTLTTNADIYYTLDDTEPSNSSEHYTLPFSLGNATVVKAIAYKGSDYSDVSTYNVPKYTTPTISFDNSTSTFTITSEGTVYYNMGNGSQAAPTPSSGTLYSEPFIVSPPTTVKAIATHAGYLDSDVAILSTQDYLTFNVLDNGTICWKSFGSNSSKTIEYRINNGEWTSITSTSDGVTFSVKTGDVVRFKGSNPTYATNNKDYSGFDGGTARFNIKGNIMSLLYGDNFTNDSPLPNQAYIFCSLFKNARVVSAENLLLPATSLTGHCYRSMFSKCTTLEVAPALPATTLAASCYYYMFEECAITSAPELPATTLTNSCYGYMFKGCTSLTSAPELPVITLASKCYEYMFNGCTSLASAPELPATTLAPNCYSNMFNGCTSLTSAPTLPVITLESNCYEYMFKGCTSLTSAPALPATTLASSCYSNMFNGCTSLTSSPVLPASNLVQSCYENMFKGCTNLNFINCLATDGFNTTKCLNNWVDGVSPVGTFLKAKDISWSIGTSGIPSGWNECITELVAPVINCDGDFITISCQTYGSSIYYRLDETVSYSLFSAPIVIFDNTLVEAYAVKDESQSDIVSENCIATKSYRFAGMKITPGPLYYGSNGYEIKDSWNYDSYNTIHGKTIGSTYFSFIELGQLFESSVFSASDGDIEKVLDPLNGWRVPTNAEWASILGTDRSGSTVNGSSNKHYAMIEITGVSGLLIFPDGETITGAALSNMDNTTSNTITESQLDNYLSQGCVFLPGSGYYDGTWNNGHYYWSSTENNSSTGHVSSGDTKNKENCYFPVYLVKDAADEATRLLKTWTYNGNEVELPYSVNAIDGHSGSYARGTFTFTTNVKVKELKPTYLWFQHADQSAAVYVDNSLVEKHWGGYNAFFVDITDYVHLGTNNIKVAIKNDEGSNLAPCAGDFNFNATLGEVKLISSPVVPSPDYGYDGFHITSTVTSASATITVKTKVPTGASLTCSIKGENCDYSNTQTSTGEEITFTTTITNPHLWNGTLDPYLYDVTLTIAKDGVVYHQFKRGYGFRFFEYVIDNETPANSRFMLNGSPYLLRGVCMHHDLEGKANALTAADIDNDFEILKELKCNFVRLAHYPHPKEVYDWCDKLGIIVQTEVPWVNNAQSTQPSDYYTHLEGQYRDMVNQHYNHPSIIFWGLSNETTTDNKDFVKGKINGYITLIKNLDASRWVGYVMPKGVNDPSGYYNDPDADWFGCNIYVGWYDAQYSNDPTSHLNTRLSNTLNRLSKPLAFSEYGCGGTPSCHSEAFLNTTTRGNNPRHDIEYQMWLHEGHIAAIKNHPELLFTSQWQLFDIAVSNRTEGYKVCLDGTTVFDNNELKYLNNKGLVERDHKTKKDPFYLYKAWWNPADKFVHICGKDYKDLTNRVIKCYTNDGSTLKLFVNGTQIQTATVDNNIATFAETTFQPGDVVRVEGDNSNDTFTCTDYNVFTTEGNWDVASNWSANDVPTANCDVSIIADATVPSGCTANAGNITLYGSTLTITDGGQLICNNAVNATVQKNISKYTVQQNQGEEKTDGWYFIASPITEDYTLSGSSMVAGTYDLYRLNNTIWENQENNEHSDFTTLSNGKGYLYANAANVTLSFTGEINPYSTANDANTIDIDDGWNLIGNPYTFNIYINKPYYKMNAAGSDVDLVAEYWQSANYIPAGTGVVVKSDGSSTVTFTKTAPDAPDGATGNNGNITMTLARTNMRGNAVQDKAVVSFNEDVQLSKFIFNENTAKLYIPQNGEDYAIAFSHRHGDMDLHFKATELGTYTISFTGVDMDLTGVYLIDILEEKEIDLSVNPSYTFMGSPADRTSRFKIVFRNNDDITFAYQNGSDIIVSGEGELQIFDVMGRKVSTQYVNGIEKINVNAQGVYIFKLNEKTQKIVIR